MELKEELTVHFPCPACGGQMAFEPDLQMLKCAYCEKTATIGQINEEIVEHDFSNADDAEFQNWGHEKKVMHCESCGAQTVIDSTDAAQFCAFCGSSRIGRHDESAGIRPESLIPFQISMARAADYFKVWMKKKWFAPGDLKTEHRSKGISGIYIPCWTYDAATLSQYSGEGGTYYYVTVQDTRVVNGKNQRVSRQERRIRWWPASGSYASGFNDVLVNASSQVDAGLMTKLEPFNLEALVGYKPEVLAGFLAEKYSISLKDGWNEAIHLIEPSIRHGIIQQIGADVVRSLNIQTAYSDIKFKHILLPVWISAYTYRNKVYKFMVNGQTGEVQGYAPLSAWKITGAVFLALALIGVIWVIVMNWS